MSWNGKIIITFQDDITYDITNDNEPKDDL